MKKYVKLGVLVMLCCTILLSNMIWDNRIIGTICLLLMGGVSMIDNK